MQEFADKHNIQLQKTPPLHPSSNSIETFMRPLGQTMKIGHNNKQNERGTLHPALDNYRQTPHPATGISPAAMLFRDGMQSKLPRRSVTENQVTEARIKDALKKDDNETHINSLKYRKQSSFKVGDIVWIRNYNKQRKFDPLFIPEPYEITQINPEGNKITVKNTVTNNVLCRHPDDVKPCRFPIDMDETLDAEYIPQETLEWPEYADYLEDDNLFVEDAKLAPGLRRSIRERRPNSRFKDYVLE